jgi:hypothetical protein
MAPKRRDPVTSTAIATRYERAHLGTGDQKLVKPMANPITGNAQKVGFQLIRYANLISSKECQS